MGRLLVTAICSVDGYVADTEGSFEFAFPTAEVHQAVNDLERGVGTQLLGRRTYEVMTYWETAPTEGDDPEADFARIWSGVEKVVFSTTLAEVSAPRTRLVRAFDVEAVRALVEAAPHDVEIGGPTLAAEAWRAGLVDEVRLFLVPAIVGGGLAALPDGVRHRLTLLEQRTYDEGFVLLRYAVQH
ncbi:dihydrofolate reductase family protein [Longivirga aurantiaca]|uniref:Dihydrofolate reductase family protein n=1 Tax=Longivirga aurantiaca TaxID=1837743 RepID=A0ABW1SYB2_9ACTN